MSHFTVLVRLPSSLTFDEISSGLDNDDHPLNKALAPYQENNMGDCPPEYMAFEDIEDAYLREYNEDSIEMVKLEVPDKLHDHPGVDETMKQKMAKLIKLAKETKTVGDYVYQHDQLGRELVVMGAKPVFVPHKQVYATFEEFMEKWAGHDERDEKTGRYGYWENPNKKWDWWTVGGRWRGHLTVKPDCVDETVLGAAGLGEMVNGEKARPETEVDVCRISALDLDSLAMQHRRKIDEAWVRWEELIHYTKTGEKPFRQDPKTGKLVRDEWFDHDARREFIDRGMLVCKFVDELTDEDKAALLVADHRRWTNPNWNPGREMIDIIVPTTKETFVEVFQKTYSPIKTYAFLDATPNYGAVTPDRPLELPGVEVAPKDRWNQPGQMGWFGFSAATKESRLEYAEAFNQWLFSGDQNDWIVVVDAHI